MAREVFFVGSIPLERTATVFQTLAHVIGDRAARIPDGELGDRKYWVSSQYPVLAASPAIEHCEFPIGGLTRQTSYELPLRARNVASDADFQLLPLGYARHAIASFGLFDAMQKAGKLPKRWRFQVNLPLPMDVMSMMAPESRARVEPHYEKALLHEIQGIQRSIPADKLAITIDIVRGVLFWEAPDNKYFPSWFDNPLEVTVDSIVRLVNVALLPTEVGLHLCYGSQDHKHALEPRDLSACVRLANAVAAKVDRAIDYVHMPVPRERQDNEFFAPLSELNSSVKELFLGLVHYTDGLEGAKSRITAAKTYRQSFGVAAECGFGRRPAQQDVNHLISLHAEVADMAG